MEDGLGSTFSGVNTAPFPMAGKKYRSRLTPATLSASTWIWIDRAHPLHADIEVCPICGRTGDYASKTGNLVERVHDPLGVELFIWGRIHGEAVRMLNRKHLPGLKELLGIADRDIVLSRPNREVMNTEALAAVMIRSKK